MTAYVITEDGRGLACATSRRSGRNALCELFGRVTGCFEVRSMGARREPVEVTAQWLMSNCREVELF